MGSLECIAPKERGHGWSSGSTSCVVTAGLKGRYGTWQSKHVSPVWLQVSQKCLLPLVYVYIEHKNKNPSGTSKVTSSCSAFWLRSSLNAGYLYLNLSSSSLSLLTKGAKDFSAVFADIQKAQSTAMPHSVVLHGREPLHVQNVCSVFGWPCPCGECKFQLTPGRYERMYCLYLR